MGSPGRGGAVGCELPSSLRSENWFGWKAIEINE